MPRSSITEIMSAFEPVEREGLLLSTPDGARRRTLRRWTEQGRLISPHPGLFARPEHWSAMSRTEQEICRLRTLAKLHPAWMFCSYSAAVLQGLSVSHSLLDRVHLALPDGGRGRDSKAVRYHRFRSLLLPSHAQGVLVTEIMYTVAECLLDAPFRAGLAIADSTIHRGLLSKEALVAYVGAVTRNKQGAARARMIAQLADGRAESGGESLARAAMIEQGFMVPELQVEFPDPVDPTRRFRVDYLWILADGRRVIGEFDGLAKYEDKEMTNGRTSERVRADERQRESRLTLLGMPVVRLNSADLRRPALFARKLQAAGIPQDPSLGFPTDPRDLR